jgi:4-amino-4-deoxy-L-arabinose transferase-like glycosyltransferase
MDNPARTNEMRTPGAAWLVIAGAILAALLTAAVRVCPPFEGDAYEYAEIALHWVEHGTLTERHLRNFNVPDLAPVHPAAQRANYYTALVAPFAAVFRDSPWTVFFPGLLGFLFASWAAFAAGRRLFGGAVAWWAALLVLLHPRFLYLTAQDPEPALWLAGLCVCSAALFHQKKYAASGALLGVAVFVKQTAAALLPAYFLYVLLFDRQELKKARLWLGLAACLLTMSPFLIRNEMLFGNPLYTEEAAARQNFDPRTLREGNLLETTFTLRDPAPGSADNPFFLWKTLQLFDVNFMDVLLGADYIDYGPGFVPLIYFAAAPFFILGLWWGRDHAGVRLCALVIACFLLLVMLVVVPFESRYIFPAAVFGILVAVYGVMEAGRRVAWLRPRAVLAFVLLTGPVFTLPLLAVHFAQNRIAAAEHIAAARYLKRAAAEDATIMAWPPFAASFYSGRSAVPLPYGGLERIREGIDRYSVDYLLFSDLLDEGEPPAVDFLEPVAKGETVTLYKVDRGAPGFRDFERHYGVIRASFDPLRSIYRFLNHGVPMRLDWGLERFLAGLPGGWFAAAALFAIFFHQFAGWSARGGAGARALAALLIVALCIGGRAGYVLYAQARAPHAWVRARAPVNPDQLRAASGPRPDTVFFIGGESACGEMRICNFGPGLKHYSQEESLAPGKRGPDWIPEAEQTGLVPVWVVFVEDRMPLETVEAVELWPVHALLANRRVRPVLEQARRSGYAAVRIGGGFVLRPAQDFGVGAAEQGNQ